MQPVSHLSILGTFFARLCCPSPLHQQPSFLQGPTSLIGLENVFFLSVATQTSLSLWSRSWLPQISDPSSVAPMMHCTPFCCTLTVSYKWLVSFLSLPTPRNQGHLIAKIYWIPTKNQSLFHLLYVLLPSSRQLYRTVTTITCTLQIIIPNLKDVKALAQGCKLLVAKPGFKIKAHTLNYHSILQYTT